MVSCVVCILIRVVDDPVVDLMLITHPDLHEVGYRRDIWMGNCVLNGEMEVGEGLGASGDFCVWG